MRAIPMLAMLAMAGPAAAQMMQAPAAAPAIPPGYLAGKPPVDILKVLPPPPAPGSVQDRADRQAYADSAAGIGGKDWQEAITELNPAGPEFFGKLSCALGARLGREATPATYALLARVGVDYAAPMTLAKNHYARPRPYTTDAGKACDPVTADGKGEKLGFAYPSGHSGIGWLWALVLGDVAPARSDRLKAFGMATGDLRIACRVHWLSDVAYGRVLATAVYDRLAADPGYQADVRRAAAEVAAAPAPACN